MAQKIPETGAPRTRCPLCDRQFVGTLSFHPRPSPGLAHFDSDPWVVPLKEHLAVSEAFLVVTTFWGTRGSAPSIWWERPGTLLNIP